MRDVFLCHVIEDRKDVVRPLRDALRAAGISSWLDEAEIRTRENVASRVNEGLCDSRFAIVVLSSAFLTKLWPRKIELTSALSVQSPTGGVRVLPLLAGAQHERYAILSQLPFLRENLCLTWDADKADVIEAIRRALDGSEKIDDLAGHIGGSPSSDLAYCSRCGAIPRTPIECSLGYTEHEFVPGMGKEFCSRCGIKPGTRAECTLGYTHHEFVVGTGKESCSRCGTRPGTQAECTSDDKHHEFNTGVAVT